jgi:hypothetical protein
MTKKEKLYTLEEANERISKYIDMSAERLYQKLLARKNEASQMD